MATPMKFIAKEKAYKYAQAQNELKPGNWCPLLNAQCRADCVCWKYAYVRESSQMWWVYAAECDNAMFSGGRFDL